MARRRSKARSSRSRSPSTPSAAKGSRSSASSSAITPRQVALLAAMYLAYVINVCSSSAVEIAVPLLAADDGVALGMAELSSGMAAGQVATVLGKVVAGPVVDGRRALTGKPGWH